MIEDALARHDLLAIRTYKKQLPKPDLSHIPSERGIPFAGQFFQFLTNAHKQVNKMAERNGPVFRLRSFHLENVFLLGPEANRLVLKNEDKTFSNHIAWNSLFRDVFDNNILERDFASHKYHRKILQLAFKRNAIEGYTDTLNNELEIGIKSWQTGSYIKLMPMLKDLLLSAGSKVFLGVETGKESDKLNQAFVDMVASTADPFRKNIPFTPYAKGVKGRATLSKFIFDNIDEKRRVESSDIFSKICHLADDDGNLFSNEDIRDHINFLLFAAHDTTTSTLSSILYLLATHTEWQERLRQEIFGLNKEQVDIEDTEKMHQAALVFKEAIRMYPALCFFFRHALKPFEVNGVKVPANTPVAISPLYTHYMEEYWTNPYQFDPERFSPERAEDKKDFYQYIPFSGGAHKCLGLHFAEIQVKVFLFHLLKNYRVTKKPGSQYKYNNVPLTFPSNGLPLMLHKL